jgi:hypothetical protein
MCPLLQNWRGPAETHPAANQRAPKPPAALGPRILRKSSPGRPAQSSSHPHSRKKTVCASREAVALHAKARATRPCSVATHLPSALYLPFRLSPCAHLHRHHLRDLVSHVPPSDFETAPSQKSTVLLAPPPSGFAVRPCLPRRVGKVQILVGADLFFISFDVALPFLASNLFRDHHFRMENALSDTLPLDQNALKLPAPPLEGINGKAEVNG